MAGDHTQQAMLDRARARELAARPKALATYLQLMDRKNQGKAQKDDAARLRAAREILKRSGGIPRAEDKVAEFDAGLAEGEREGSF
jgi:tRNA A37 N6-isopentenylltransferase MiaA